LIPYLPRYLDRVSPAFRQRGGQYGERFGKTKKTYLGRQFRLQMAGCGCDAVPPEVLQEKGQQLAAAGVDPVHLAEVQLCLFRFPLHKFGQPANQRPVELRCLFTGATPEECDAVVINKYYFTQFVRSPLELRLHGFSVPFCKSL
jgi:hypothetical protein